MAQSPAYVTFDGAVAELVLNRPSRLNAIDEEMLLSIRAGLQKVESDHSIRALVLRAEGRAFCAGADLAAAGSRLREPDAMAEHAAMWRDVFDYLECLPVPTIAAVHGVAVAGGLELTLACDLVLLADDARIGDGHAKWGLLPSGGATQRLPRLVGRRHASWLLFSGELITATQALDIGLVNEAVPASELRDRARALARTIAARSPASVASLKRAVREGLETPTLAAGLELEWRLLEEHQHRADMKIGQAAFMSRSEPAFPDR